MVMAGLPLGWRISAGRRYVIFKHLFHGAQSAPLLAASGAVAGIIPLKLYRVCTYMQGKARLFAEHVESGPTYF